MSAINLGNEWQSETIECRINNEAYTLKLKDFTLLNTERDLDFTASLSLIDAIENIYKLDDHEFSIHKECKTVLELSRREKLKIDINIRPTFSNCVRVNSKIDDDITKEEYEHVLFFKNHIALMLEIWKSAVSKKWSQYFKKDFVTIND
jgi:hypothetical protein